MKQIFIHDHFIMCVENKWAFSVSMLLIVGFHSVEYEYVYVYVVY